jgi:cardiolipin synthase
MVAVVFLVAQILGVLSSIDVVYRGARTSQGTIAWAVALNALPIVAVPAYWVLGRSRFHGYVTARRGEDSEIREIGLNARALAEPFVVPPEAARDVGAVRAAVSLADIPLLRGNHVELLVDGPATFESILAGIDGARDYILFQFFIVKDDELGGEVQRRLIAKAREGVPVYFLYDEVGSHSLPGRYKKELRSAGIEVYDFHTQQGLRNRFQLNFRNHRKVVVVDGKEAWIGGHNVGDEYMGRDAKFGRWRDTHVRIAGPAALAAQLSFVEDWYWATGRVPEVDWMPDPAPESDMKALVIPTGPADELESATLMFIHAIHSARTRVWIASPYFVPDEAVMAALHLAGLRGVDVRILIPDHPDHLLVYLAAYSYFDEASETGADFYRYTDGFLHQKVVLIDDVSAAVGTANFDNRSFRLNFEITALVADPAFAAEVEEMFEADFARSRRMERGELDRKSFWFKLGVKLARLTSPIQ